MNRGFASLAGLLLASTTLALPASAETLREAMAAAYANNPTLQAQRSSLRATDESVPLALSGWRPSVQVTADAARTRIWSESPGTTGATVRRDPSLWPLSAGISVSQPVYTGGRVEAGLQAAENSVLAGRAGLASVEQNVLLGVVQAYMSVLSGEAVLDLTRKNVQVLQRQLEASQDRFRVGEITRTDVSQAEGRLAEARALRVEAEGDLQTARANYEAVVGHAPANLSAPDFALNLPDTLPQAIELAADENPTVVARAFSARAAESGVDQIEGELYPAISLVASADRRLDQTAADTETDAVRVGVNVTIPLYQSGATYARIREQKHIANEQRILVDRDRRDAVEQATAAWESWQSSRAVIEARATQIRAQEIALEGVQREAQVGSRTVLDVLDAERELLNARVELVQAQSTEQVEAFRLMQAVGRLTAPSLGLPTDLYDPTQNYMEVRGKWFGTDAALIPAGQ